jgi:hypothetical protein
MKLSDKAHNLRGIIEKAIEDQRISKAEYELIIHSATEDGHIDPQELALLGELQEMISEKTVRIVP